MTATVTTAPTPRRSPRGRIPRRLAGALALCAVAAGAALGMGLAGPAASEAGAWAWSPTVTLGGQANCGVLPLSKVTGVWLWTAEEGGTWTPYSGRNYAEPYGRTFRKVPSGGTTVHYDLYCGGMKMHGTFGLQRPAFGQSATRNLSWRW
jgi:hypothetical protein